jgi:hypothetical protein
MKSFRGFAGKIYVIFCVIILAKFIKYSNVSKAARSVCFIHIQVCLDICNNFIPRWKCSLNFFLLLAYFP